MRGDQRRKKIEWLTVVTGWWRSLISGGYGGGMLRGERRGEEKERKEEKEKDQMGLSEVREMNDDNKREEF